MQNDLISRSAALELCQKEYDKRLQMFDYCGDTVAYNIGGAIKSLPAVDADPIVYAKWEHIGGDEWCCSNCGEVISTEGSWVKPVYKRCYECGARMDGKEANQWN